MRMCLVRYQFCFLTVLFTLVPSTAMALAGLGEHDSTFHYNTYTKVIWQHPGEFCDKDSETSDRYCLEFKRENREGFKDLESSLEEINAPSDPFTPYIIAKRSGDGKWLVYDLEKEKHLITGVAYLEALFVWQSLGLSEPSFIDSINPEKFLTETATSLKRRLKLKFTFWVFPAFVLSILFGILAADSNREHKKAGLKRYLILYRLFTSLAGLSVLFVMAVIGFCTFV